MLDATGDEFLHTRMILRALSLIAVAGHLVILAFALATGITPLALYNIGSCLVYGFVFLLNKRRHYSGVMVVAIAEVTIHSYLAVLLTGWSSGFHIYLVCLIPLVMSFQGWSFGLRFAVSSLVLAAHGLLRLIGLGDDPRYLVDAIEFVSVANHVIAAVVFGAIAFYYSVASRNAEGRK